jgi:hypothetical protein
MRRYVLTFESLSWMESTADMAKHGGSDESRIYVCILQRSEYFGGIQTLVPDLMEEGGGGRTCSAWLDEVSRFIELT